MRIITRPDFDGIVCAVLLCEALGINEQIYWIEPHLMHAGLVDIHDTDIIANLSYHPNCLLWFDHHQANRTVMPFNGAFKIAPSAAGIIFDFFNQPDAGNNPKEIAAIANRVKKFQRNYTELVAAADKIDSAQLTPQEVEDPEKNSYVMLSMTITGHNGTDEAYWNHLVDLLRKYEIHDVLKDPEVSRRCKDFLIRNRAYASLLKKHTVVNGHLSITDFRGFEKGPGGNRFLVFSLFPGTSVNVKIRFHDVHREKVIVSIGHNMFNRQCRVNAGLLCSGFGGGGHFGAGSCSFHVSKTDEFLPIIIDTLLKNEENAPLIPAKNL